MQQLIGSSRRSHSVERDGGASWSLGSHGPFQSLLQRGLEVRTHWAGERLWWKRVLYVPADVSPPTFFVERNKQTESSAARRVALATIQEVRQVHGEPRVIEIEHPGRRLGIEFPTVGSAVAFQRQLRELLDGLGLARGESGRREGGTEATHDDPQHRSPQRLTGRVAAQSHSRDGHHDGEQPYDC